MRGAVRLLIVGALAAVTPAALAPFTGSSSASNSVTSDTDWMGPTVDRSVIAKTTGYLAGSVKPSGSYNVYANITDSGNQAAGLSGGSAGATADVQTVTVGQSSVLMTSTGGPWTVEGSTYNYRSSRPWTVTNPLTAGSKNYSIASTDAEGNASSTNFTVTVDNTGPNPTDIQTTNSSGGTPGGAETGDTIVFTFSERIDPYSILAGWAGSSTNVIVRLHDGGCLLNLLIKVCSDDSFEVFNGASALATLGPVDLNDPDYVGGGLIGTAADAVFGSTGTPSTMAQSGGSITITLGTRSGSNAGTGGSADTQWNSASSPYDAAGNPPVATSRRRPAGAIGNSDPR